MDNDNIKEKVATSVKWSSLGEVAAKLVTPFTSMILARIITPEEFGVIATINMVISFADIFIDAGFQKYIIQKNFNSKKELDNNVNVAFWTNVAISLLVWMFLAIFSERISSLAGNPGQGNVITISSISIVFTAFSSMQTAVYKKKFDFKTLFVIRMLGVVVPVVITVPLALIGFSYWSIVIGTLVTRIVTAVVLTWKSEWRPRFYYNSTILKNMLGFSLWILLESILLWMTSYCDVFLIGTKMNSYYLGLYKNSITMVNGLFNIIVSSTSAVLLSALSVVKERESAYLDMFYSFQRSVAFLMIPIGVGIFIYRDLATSIILGSQWKEASLLVGLWGLANSITILTGQYISIVFTSKGRPRLAVASQVLQLAEMIPLLIVGGRYGFNGFVIMRCIARIMYGVINIILARVYLKMSIWDIFRNLLPMTVSAFVMGVSAVYLGRISGNVIWQIISIIIDAIIYFGVSMIFPSSRMILTNVLEKIVDSMKKRRL